MTLEKLEQEIIEQAKKEAQEIVSKAEQEAKAISRDAEKRVQQKRQEIEARTEQHVEHMRQMGKIKSRMQQKQALLDEKRAQIEQVYEGFYEMFENRKESWFKTLFENAKKQIKPKRVLVQKNDTKIAEKTFKGLEISAYDIKGGFILESADGLERVDYSIETLLEIIRSKTIKQVTAELFGE